MLCIDVKKSYSGFTLDIAADIECSGITVLFGASGAGKSTLVKIIAGLTAPDRGSVLCNGEIFFDSTKKINLPPEKRGIGFMFQEHRLFPHMTVRQNICFAQRYGRRTPPADPMEIADFFGISHLLERNAASLSGGESQRTALARAISAAENFIIMDEPLSSLDEERRESLMHYIAMIPKRFVLPVLYITHSRKEVEALADRVITFADGKIINNGINSAAGHIPA